MSDKRPKSDEVLRLLLVDDDEVDRMTIKRNLAAADVAAVVDELADGKDVVARVAAERYDCILLDHRLPGETAFEVIARLREAGSTVPILAVAGQDEDIGAALVAAGATDFLPKEDVTPARLAGRVRYVQRLSRAELALNVARFEAERQRVLMRSALRNLPTGVAVICEDRVLLTNPAAETVLGRDASALVDPPNPLGETAWKLVAAAIGKSEPVAAELPVVHGGRRYRLAATPVEAVNGGPPTAILTLDDVTELLAAREAAERAASSRADILAVVSHDLRGPLNSIGVALDALKDDTVVGAERARYAAAVTRSIERADRMIADLLTASQIEAGTLRIEPISVSTKTLLEQARKDHELVATKSSTAINVAIHDDVVVKADRERVLQALGNLIQNALRHARGSKAIELSAKRAAKHVALVVRDHGPGIPPEALDHLFDRYWQGRDKRGGAGLGLAIVRGIAMAHGGDARAAQADGGGAEFTILLPNG
jgi:signal transduction histidine kinase